MSKSSKIAETLRWLMHPRGRSTRVSKSSNEYKAEALRWFAHARSRSDRMKVDFEIDCFKACLRKAKLSLSDIGLEDSEIEELLEEGYRAETLRYLHNAHNYQCAEEFLRPNVETCREYLGKANFNSSRREEIEKELKQLLP